MWKNCKIKVEKEEKRTKVKSKMSTVNQKLKALPINWYVL